MYKALALLRTVFLVFIIVYTLVAAPMALWDSATATVTVDSVRTLQRAAWIAIAWIAVDTLLAWIVLAFRKPRAPVPDSRREVGADSSRATHPPRR